MTVWRPNARAHRQCTQDGQKETSPLTPIISLPKKLRQIPGSSELCPEGFALCLFLTHIMQASYFTTPLPWALRKGLRNSHVSHLCLLGDPCLTLPCCTHALPCCRHICRWFDHHFLPENSEKLASLTQLNKQNKVPG